MKITRVHYTLDVDRKRDTHPLAKCYIVLDDVLMLSEIRIFDGKNGVYLVNPSMKYSYDPSGSPVIEDGLYKIRKGVYSKVGSMDDSSKGGLVLHPQVGNSTPYGGKSLFKDFFHSVDRSFSTYINQTVKEGYEKAKELGRESLSKSGQRKILYNYVIR